MFKFLKIFYKCGLSIVIIDKNQILNPFGKKKMLFTRANTVLDTLYIKMRVIRIIYHTIVGYSYVYV